jgi:hypothetical protein
MGVLPAPGKVGCWELKVECLKGIMPQREFDITIAPDGSVEVHVKGYKGKSCLEAMKIFEKVVGEIKSQRETSEFYEPDEQVQFKIEQRH